MVFRWFDASEAKELGASLARVFMEKAVIDDSNMKSKLVAKKQAELLSNLSRQVVHFKLDHKLNIYTKAKLGNAFKWTLRNAGYDSKYVDELTTWLMLNC